MCFWVNYACTKNKESLGQWDWKLVVLFQLFVPVCILSLLITIPGTPRWYVSSLYYHDSAKETSRYIKRHDDVRSARRALLKVRLCEREVEDEINMIRDGLEYERTTMSTSYSALWKDRSVRKRLLLAFIINAGQQVTGQGTLNTYSTIIYKKVWPSPNQIALINALNATFGIIFTLNAVWTVDRFGRKFLLVIGGIGMGICMIVVATVETQTPTNDGVKSRPVGIAIVFLLYSFIFFCKCSPFLPFHMKHISCMNFARQMLEGD